MAFDFPKSLPPENRVDLDPPVSEMDKGGFSLSFIMNE